MDLQIQPQIGAAGHMFSLKSDFHDVGRQAVIGQQVSFHVGEFPAPATMWPNHSIHAFIHTPIHFAAHKPKTGVLGGIGGHCDGPVGKPDSLCGNGG